MLGKIQSLLIVAGILLVARSDAIFFTVAAHREQCFFEHIQEGLPVGVTFQVISGGFLDIDVLITGPAGNEIHKGTKEQEGKYFFVASTTGVYKACFSNTMSTVTPKQISMTFNAGHVKPASEKKEQGDNHPVSFLQKAILTLADDIASVRQDEKYIRVRERVHRDTSESTNSRVLWWSILETALLVSMSLWQIYYLKRFFEVKRTV